VNRREIHLWGLDNPWRVAVDQVTGDLWIGDVGQNKYEEINSIPADARSAHMGWPCHEGKAVYDASRCPTGFTYLPEVAYCHTGAPGCDPDLAGQSVTGGEILAVTYTGSLYRLGPK
jgi:glucose/arabinose dehydrogenase